ncbi:MAG TPA: hypothetical protein VM432_07075 [Bdellovibrionales bacterium]|nr:hypothetical protein [Bdellovibrionales bacterium]
MKTALALLALSVGTSAFASSGSDLLGTYTSKSVVRFPGYNAPDCKADGGEFDDDYCYFTDEDGNTLTITEAGKDTTVSISVLYGAANERSFDGVVTNQSDTLLSVQEAELAEDGSVISKIKDGCDLEVSIDQDGIADVAVGEACDSNLSRVSGAKKK